MSNDSAKVVAPVAPLTGQYYIRPTDRIRISDLGPYERISPWYGYGDYIARRVESQYVDPLGQHCTRAYYYPPSLTRYSVGGGDWQTTADGRRYRYLTDPTVVLSTGPSSGPVVTRTYVTQDGRARSLSPTRPAISTIPAPTAVGARYPRYGYRSASPPSSVTRRTNYLKRGEGVGGSGTRARRAAPLVGRSYGYTSSSSSSGFSAGTRYSSPYSKRYPAIISQQIPNRPNSPVRSLYAIPKQGSSVTRGTNTPQKSAAVEAMAAAILKPKQVVADTGYHGLDVIGGYPSYQTDYPRAHGILPSGGYRFSEFSTPVVHRSHSAGLAYGY